MRLLRSTIDVKNLKDDEELGLLLGIAQTYIFYEIQGFSLINPKPVMNCNLNLPVEMNFNQKKKYFRNHKIKKPVARKKDESKSIATPIKSNTVKSTSDSEISDGDIKSNETVLDRKVRLEAAHLLNDIVQCNSHEFAGYWMQIVSSSSSRDNLRTLIKYIVCETAQANKTIALNILNELLLGSKIFLSHAIDTERSSYDSIFYLLGLSIKEIHDSIHQLLKKENRILPIVQALKCTSALVEVTPFSRLNYGLASKLAKLVYPYLTHKGKRIKKKKKLLYNNNENFFIIF